MTIEIVPFKPEHFQTLQLQGAQSYFESFYRNDDYGRKLMGAGPAFSGIEGGQCIASIGAVLMPGDSGRAMGWGLLSEEAGGQLIRIHKATKRWISMCGFRRLEIVTNPEFEEAAKWATLLGFQREGRMRSWRKDGTDLDLWALVSGEML